MSPSIADSTPDCHTLLGEVPPAEMPAKAAQIVKREAAHAQKATTVAVVKAANARKSAAALSVVGAISRSVPEMAPVAAATAAGAQRRFAWAFARTAALAAPDQASEVVFEVASAVPEEALSVATAVTLAVPDAADASIAALGRAVTNLQPYLAEAILLSEGRDVSPSAIITLAGKLSAAAPWPTPIRCQRSPLRAPPRVSDRRSSIRREIRGR